METILIRNGRIFSGYDRPSVTGDVLVRDGKVETVSESAIEIADVSVFDASGKWVAPGFIDNHTHYDGEVLAAPALGESVRHGVTTAIVGGCSLSFVYADFEDCADMFTRVEAFPRDLLFEILKEGKTWSTPCEWIEHIRSLDLGPNIASFIGHSDIRAWAMGIDRSLSETERPTPDEIKQMESMLEEALDAGFIGISMQHNPWDKMDGRHWSKLLPAAYARAHERNALTRIARRRGAHLQGVPNLVNRIALFWYLAQSSGFFWRKPLRTSLVAMMDLKGDPYIRGLISLLATTFNKLFRADFRMQAFPVPFRVFARGMDLVIFEEFPTGAVARHLANDLGKRNETLNDPDYRARFKKHYKNKLAPKVWQKDFGDAFVVDAPDKSWIGRSFGQLAEDRGQHPVDAFLDIVVDLDQRVLWETTIGNHDPSRYKPLYNDPNGIIGFADSGAHINNMAFYNFPLRMLRYVQASHEKGEPIMSFEKTIWRLTKENADFFGLDAGTIEPGKRADIVVIDPAKLSEAVHEYHEDEFIAGHRRLVNRNDDVVELVLIGGKTAWRNGAFSERFGNERYGDFLSGNHI